MGIVENLIVVFRTLIFIFMNPIVIFVPYSWTWQPMKKKKFIQLMKFYEPCHELHEL